MAKRGCCTILHGNDTANYDYAGIGIFDMGLELLIRTDYCLNDMLHRPETFLRSGMRSRVLFQESPTGKLVPELMRYILNYHSSNPKDKMFGFYSILKETGLYMPQPDYGHSLDRVYWSGTLALLNQQPTLALLPLASGVDSHIPGAPSWAGTLPSCEIQTSLPLG